METLEAASRARQWATLGMTVNKAEYTLLRLLKKRGLDDAAISYSGRALELLKLLDMATHTARSQDVSWGRHLAAAAAVEPIRRTSHRRVFSSERVKRVLDLFRNIDRDKDNEAKLQRYPESRLIEALHILQGWSDAYAAAGFAALQERRRIYDRPFTVKGVVQGPVGT